MNITNDGKKTKTRTNRKRTTTKKRKTRKRKISSENGEHEEQNEYEPRRKIQKIYTKPNDPALKASVAYDVTKREIFIECEIIETGGENKAREQVKILIDKINTDLPSLIQPKKARIVKTNGFLIPKGIGSFPTVMSRLLVDKFPNIKSIYMEGLNPVENNSDYFMFNVF
jgi:hypothetical protein